MNPYETMSREDLLRALTAFARNWLAHDGCWFVAVEARLGMEAAIDLDTAAWRLFAAAEARRLLEVFAIPAGGGLPVLERALSPRMHGEINQTMMFMRPPWPGCPVW